MSTDPIGDMIAMLWNANHKYRERVDVPASHIKKNMAHLLKEEGYISDYKLISGRKQGVIRISLKFLPDKSRALQGIKRVSRPGLRVYRGWEELRKVRGGLGMCIISTSKGLLTDHQSRKQKVGGEILAQVW